MKVFVAGHKGLAGSAICRALGGHQVITTDRADLDLRDSIGVDQFLNQYQPDAVVIAAAVVGGITANKNFPVQFMLDNLKIQNNLIECSHKHKVKKLLFLASNCMYPKLAPQPMAESCLFQGPFEPTNEPYALAKVAGTKLCAAFNRQYGTDFMTMVPSTLYGPYDNYHWENAHVLPMLLRRFHEAKLRGDREVVVWGSGSPLREFLHSDDMASAALMLLEKYHASDLGEFINVGSGQEITILELAKTLQEVVGLKAEIVFDRTKPDGTPRKFLDSSKAFALGFKPKISFAEGLRRTYEDFVSNPNQRL
jgi:GDP-L-fucose synthase